MGQFDDFSNPWSANNSEWYNDEYTKFDTTNKIPNNDIWSKGSINHDRWFSSIDDQFSIPKKEDQQQLITFNILDTAEAATITHVQTGIGSSYRTTNNKLVLNKFTRGVYYLKVYTKSEGIYDTQFYVDGFHPITLLEFKKLDFDFELGRVDNNNLPILANDVLFQTFVSTDEIKIQFSPTDEYSYLSDELTPELTKLGFGFKDIKWEVKGVTKNDGTVEIQKSDFEFVHSFIPKPINRPTNRPTTTRNTPIKHIVYATLLGLKKSFELTQDEIDILRQEYIDFNTTFQPQRSNIYRDTSEFNVGNYNYIATESNDNHFQTIFNAIVNNWQDKGYTSNIIISSGYRNPKRNPGVLNSRHLRGLALDIYPQGTISTQKWIDLRAAGNEITEIDGVNAHCDQSGTFVDDNCSIANHIHVQW